MSDRSDKLLWDARRAAMRAIEFLGGRDRSAYSANDLVRSAVERQIEIIGEAPATVRRLDPGLAERVPDLPRIAVRETSSFTAMPRWMMRKSG